MTSAINHHLDPATLMAFSAGSLAEPLAAVASAHIEMCAECRRQLGEMDMIGALLLDAIDQGTHRDGVVLPGRPDMSVRPLPRRIAGVSPSNGLPAGFARRFGIELEGIAWRPLGPGIQHCRLPLSMGVEGDLRLLKIAAGKHMPEHGHGGSELTLVLHGSYSDDRGRYACGDIQDIDGDGEHAPVADDVLGCVCIVASERPARFKGLIPRLLQPLTGM
jgi:putative transcriptional regulator